MSVKSIKISKKARCRGTVVLPGSKSIANRALILSSLVGGATLVRNLPDSDDVRVLLENLPALGIRVDHGKLPNEFIIHGCGGKLKVKDTSINLENAGTAFRPMVALLSTSHGDFIVDGNEQMRKRPIGDLVDALAGIGINIKSEGGFPPVTIHASGMPSGSITISAKVSSQFLTAVLLAAPLADGPVQIFLDGDPVSKPYIDLTLRMMSEFGVEVERNGYSSFLIQPASYRKIEYYDVEGDASAATYFLAAGSLPGSGPVHVKGIAADSRQGDIRFAELLERMGASIERNDGFTVKGPPAGRLKAVDVDMNDMPDAAMTLAVIAMYADGESHIRNIANLRVKESERIRGLRNELEKLGAKVVEEHDALHITPPVQMKPAVIETYKDHRMAMAFSLACFGTEIEILDPGCVSKTYPRYFEDFLPLLSES